jgi:hypothetical protein
LIQHFALILKPVYALSQVIKAFIIERTLSTLQGNDVSVEFYVLLDFTFLVSVTHTQGHSDLCGDLFGHLFLQFLALDQIDMFF